MLLWEYWAQCPELAAYSRGNSYSRWRSGMQTQFSQSLDSLGTQEHVGDGIPRKERDSTAGCLSWLGGLWSWTWAEALEDVIALGWWSQGSCRRWDAVTTFWGGDLLVCALKLSHFGRRVAGVKGKGASREWKDWRDGRHLWKVFPLQTCYTCFLYFTGLPFWKKGWSAQRDNLQL